MNDRPDPRDLSMRRLTDGHAWIGYLTLENLDAVADRIRALIGGGSRYTLVTAVEAFGFEPDVRTGQTATSITAWRGTPDDHGRVLGVISVADGDTVWSFQTAIADGRGVDRRDVPRVFVKISTHKVAVTAYSEHSSRMYWTAVAERGGR